MTPNQKTAVASNICLTIPGICLLISIAHDLFLLIK